ncbi:hypothetical protein C2E21_6170 [Chlorella sorokiniana]|jgi:hypothetical protein|uniref:Uncharacterized protein n=1 Tax=Chlorella sorokiniana TaxID=3076 RepID=A0A2P6TL02_CHLSO|nr:hypothetical protein C2E21_6170 [Chlorella sorokiniana]|eukprot:PRW44959.1 hypothetical protein C2E21_6170 [Chlorella sorokiniana]
MLPSGEPVARKLSPEGGSAVQGTAAGEAPTPEQRAAIADLHEPDPSLPKGGSSSTGHNVGPPGTSLLSAGYASTTKGSIAGSGTGTGAKPLGGSKTGTGGQAPDLNPSA